MYLKRRELLKGTIASLLYSIVPARASAEQAATLPKRVLGRTGLEVAALGYGAMQVSDPVIIRHGLEQGINYIDTADCYMGGRNEKVVGKAVAFCVAEGRDLSELSLEQLRGFSERIDADVFRVLTLEGSVAARDHLGGTAPNQVRAAIARARARLAAEQP